MRGILPARAAVVVAAVYGYFLIFAQFSFVELLRAEGIGDGGQKVVLGVMAVAGMAAGFLVARVGARPVFVTFAMGVAALSAATAVFFHSMAAAVFVGIATGGALGVATVSLAALLPAWCRLTWVGVGTGLGYALCNVPWVFNLPPVGQAWVGVGFAVVGALAIPSVVDGSERKVFAKVFPIWVAVLLFTALVWLDSAAFFIIQHADDLKTETWGGDDLWRNAVVHLVGAILAGLWLARGVGVRLIPGFAWALLAVAALAVNDQSSRWLAGWFYPAGVSIYSAALVAWPGWFSGAGDSRAAGWRAAWLFAIAGWFGSANGIGMAQNLQSVPPIFVAGTGCLMLGLMIGSNRKHWREALAVGGVLALGWFFSGKSNPVVATSAAERGRQVYVSEGCIHCHSQYVRPGTRDDEPWGPVRDVGEVLKGEPVLIGNRRQGPDLTNVGARRSAAWLKLHFLDPQSLVPGSLMPSYAHLFSGSEKGEDLVRYLVESGIGQAGAVMEKASHWQPSGELSGADGKQLFMKNCAACHGMTAKGTGPLSLNLARPPANLVAGPFAWTPAGEALDLRIARVIKFGLPGTDMPGHETMNDTDIRSLADYVRGLRK